MSDVWSAESTDGMAADSTNVLTSIPTDVAFADSRDAMSDGPRRPRKTWEELRGPSRSFQESSPTQPFEGLVVQISAAILSNMFLNNCSADWIAERFERGLSQALIRLYLRWAGK